MGRLLAHGNSVVCSDPLRWPSLAAQVGPADLEKRCSTAWTRTITTPTATWWRGSPRLRSDEVCTLTTSVTWRGGQATRWVVGLTGEAGPHRGGGGGGGRRPAVFDRWGRRPLVDGGLGGFLRHCGGGSVRGSRNRREVGHGWSSPKLGGQRWWRFPMRRRRWFSGCRRWTGCQGGKRRACVVRLQ
jgi:hypothetical protein